MSNDMRKLMENVKPLFEGTWSVPDNKEAVTALKKFMRHPQPLGVDAGKVTDELYNIWGNDTLFDELGDMADKNPNADARNVIAAWMAKTVKDAGGLEEYIASMVHLEDEDALRRAIEISLGSEPNKEM